MSPSRRWPPGRRYALEGQPGCTSCEHWHIDPDSLASGLCYYTAKGAPKRTPCTLETHTCDHYKPRRLTLAEQSIDRELAAAIHSDTAAPISVICDLRSKSAEDIERFAAAAKRVMSKMEGPAPTEQQIADTIHDLGLFSPEDTAILSAMLTPHASPEVPHE